MTATLTPLGNGTDVGETIGGKLYGRSTLHDAVGADAMGLAGASPDPVTLLGRLKAIVDELAGGIGVTGTFWPTTQPISAASLPLPTNAATAANQATGNTALAAIQTSVADAAPASTGGSLTTGSDSAALTAKAIWVGGAGNVVATVGGVDLTFTAVPAGTLLPIKATKVKAASTATNMVWLG